MAYVGDEDNALKKACIEYDPKLERHNLEKQKLEQQYDDGTAKKKLCPIFTDEGIEGLLYVEEQFRKIADKLNYEDQEIFDNFEGVLMDNSAENWESLVENIGEADRTTARFNA